MRGFLLPKTWSYMSTFAEMLRSLFGFVLGYVGSFHLAVRRRQDGKLKILSALEFGWGLVIWVPTVGIQITSMAMSSTRSEVALSIGLGGTHIIIPLYTKIALNPDVGQLRRYGLLVGGWYQYDTELRKV